jgi:hypothetical protein
VTKSFKTKKRLYIGQIEDKEVEQIRRRFLKDDGGGKTTTKKAEL